MSRAPTDVALVGRVLDGRYEVLDRLGSGGVGTVYRGRRVKLERMVAIKVLHGALIEDPGFVGRFNREAQAMSRLYHPHCVGLIDFGVYEGRPYLVMEYVPGKNIGQLLSEENRFAPRRAIAIALQLLETLEHFHNQHVLHRDLKAENVMIVTTAAGEFVKVLDFGMAKILQGPGADSMLSKLGFVPGTPSAMAPEQIQQLPPDPRLDIYAMGILLYEMIVGHRPFRGAEAQVVQMQLSAPPPRPRAVLGDSAISAELEIVMLKALEKDRHDRFATAGDMAAALRATPEGAAEVRPTALPPPVLEPADEETPPPTRRSRRLPWILGGAAGAGAAVYVMVMVQSLREPTPTVQPAVVHARIDAGVRAAPPPTPVAEPWLVHRDLAVTYAGQSRHAAALAEVKSALRDRPAAAADPALMKAAVSSLADPEADVSAVVAAFKQNPGFVDALLAATGGEWTLRRHAQAALQQLGQASKIDLVAVRIKDVEEAPTCSAMRTAFKALARSKDPRVTALARALRARGPADPHVKCLGRALKRRAT